MTTIYSTPAARTHVSILAFSRRDAVRRLRQWLMVVLLTAGGRWAMAQNEISSLEGLRNMSAMDAYVLTADLDASGFDADICFSGSLDELYHVVRGLTRPLFAEIAGGWGSNMVLADVAIGDVAGGHTRALARSATDDVTFIINHAVIRDFHGGGNQGARGSSRVKADSKVAIKSLATVNENVYGGGNRGIVYGDTEMNIGQ